MKLFSIVEGHSKTFLMNLKIKEMKLPPLHNKLADPAGLAEG